MAVAPALWWSLSIAALFLWSLPRPAGVAAGVTSAALETSRQAATAIKAALVGPLESSDAGNFNDHDVTGESFCPNGEASVKAAIFGGLAGGAVGNRSLLLAATADKVAIFGDPVQDAAGASDSREDMAGGFRAAAAARAAMFGGPVGGAADVSAGRSDFSDSGVIRGALF